MRHSDSKLVESTAINYYNKLQYVNFQIKSWTLAPRDYESFVASHCLAERLRIPRDRLL